MLLHKEIKKNFLEVCKKINAPQNLVFYNTSPSNWGGAHIKIDKKGYHYIGTERGKEIEHKITNDSDELLYWLLDEVIFSMASEFELSHRIEGQDFRRILFAKSLELFELAGNPKWVEMYKKEVANVLKKNPFSDE